MELRWYIGARNCTTCDSYAVQTPCPDNSVGFCARSEEEETIRAAERNVLGLCLLSTEYVGYVHAAIVEIVICDFEAV